MAQRGLLRGSASIVLAITAGLTGVAATVGPPSAAAAATSSSGARPSGIDHLSNRLSEIAQPGMVNASRRMQAAATSTAARGAGSLLRNAAGQYVVDVRVDAVNAAAIARLKAAGASIIARNDSLKTITVAVSANDLTAVGSSAGVQYVGEELTPMTSGVCDATISEGDGVLKASNLRANRSVDGTGQTVGILSDSFDKWVSAPTHAADDVTSDNLPGATNTCGHTNAVANADDSHSGEDEGRAMAQTVHDLAPGAKIAFRTGSASEQTFANNIVSLHSSEGATVISDDVTYFDEPFYQEGILSEAVDTVRAAGVSYFSSAANDTITLGGHDVGSYEAVDGYRATTCPATITSFGNYTDCHNFNAGGTDNTFGLTVQPNYPLTIDMQWAEPFSGVNTDYDIFLINHSTGAILASSRTRNPSAGSQKPVEVFGWTNGNSTQQVDLVVARYGGNTPNNNGTPRFKFVFLENGYTPFSAMEYTTPTGTDVMGPTIFGHNGGPQVMSMAAEDVNTPGQLSYYSSHGPVTLLFGPVSGTTPATALASAEVLAKPDVTASDCVKTTFFGGTDSNDLSNYPYRFCGTSDASPHGAAVAALLRQENPSASSTAIDNAIKSTAANISGYTASEQGAGLIDADAAGTSLAPLSATTTSVSPSVASPVWGQSETFTAHVTDTGGTGGAVTGTVTFKDGVTTLGTGNVDGSGDATFTTSSLAVSLHSIVASYGGDATHSASDSLPLALAVGQASTTTSDVSSNLNPSTEGDTVQFAATVSANAPGSGTPDGQVTFNDGVTPLGTVALSGGTAQFSTDSLSAGSHDITASYAGGTDYTGSSSADVLSQVVNEPVIGTGETSTSVVSSLNPSSEGDNVTFTATVDFSAGTNGLAVTGTLDPTEVVKFYDDTTFLGQGSLDDSTNEATFTTSTLDPGTHPITAVYQGDSDFAQSASDPLSQIVTETTHTALASSLNPSTFGQSVTFTATVTEDADESPGTETNTVTFKDGATVIGSDTVDVNGVATLTTSSLAVGTHPITAVYSGDDEYGPSTSNTVNQVVTGGGGGGGGGGGPTQTATTSTLTSSANPANTGDPVTFTATVSAAATGSAARGAAVPAAADAPAGTVTFKDGTTQLAQVALSGGTASFTTSALAVGHHSIVATYGGNSTFAGSASDSLDQVINAASTPKYLWFTEPGRDHVGQVTVDGTVSDFAIRAGGTPAGITAGPDGAAWFTEPGKDRIGRITTAGAVTDFKVRKHSRPSSITAGPDGALWFTEPGKDRIGRITVTGQASDFAVRDGSKPSAIALGADHRLWFTEPGKRRIGRMSTSGTVHEAKIARGSMPSAITAGPDGNVYFTEPGVDRIGRLASDLTGDSHAVRAGGAATSIATGPDGRVWFTEPGADRLAATTTTWTISEVTVTAGSGPAGISAS